MLFAELMMDAPLRGKSAGLHGAQLQQLFSIVIICVYGPEGAPPGTLRPKYILLLPLDGAISNVLDGVEERWFAEP